MPGKEQPRTHLQKSQRWFLQMVFWNPLLFLFFWMSSALYICRCLYCCLVGLRLVALLRVQTSHHTKNTYSPSSSLRGCQSCRASVKAESKQISINHKYVIAKTSKVPLLPRQKPKIVRRCIFQTLAIQYLFLTNLQNRKFVADKLCVANKLFVCRTNYLLRTNYLFVQTKHLSPTNFGLLFW